MHHSNQEIGIFATPNESFVNYHRNCLAVAVLDDFIQQAKENYQ